MRMQIFALYDTKIQAYNKPFAMRTTAEALRSFQDAVQQDQNIKSHAEDYVLFELAEFDDSTGIITPLSCPHSLAVAIQFVNNEGK